MKKQWNKDPNDPNVEEPKADIEVGENETVPQDEPIHEIGGESGE